MRSSSVSTKASPANRKRATLRSSKLEDGVAEKEQYLTVRMLGPEDKQLLQRKATALGQSVSDYVRDAVLDRMGGPDQRHRELEARLQLLDEKTAELVRVLDTCVRLAASGVVAAAMLRDNGKGDEEEAKERVATHIELAVRSAGHVLEVIRAVGR